MKILITGATGFIGQELVAYLYKMQHEIFVLVRNRNKVVYDFVTIYTNVDEIAESLDFDVIINLAGAPIDRRWTASYKQKLLSSRVNVLQDLYRLVSRLQVPPKIIITASAIGYYANTESKLITEAYQPSPQYIGFAHELCRLCEQQALNLQKLVANVVIIRLGVVLGLTGGFLAKTKPLFNCGLGGRLGTGKQYFSWIHIVDVLRAIEFLLEMKNPHGVYNLTAPLPITNNELTITMAKILYKPLLLPLPSIVVKTLFGEMGETLLLQGQKVIPNNLLNLDFKFLYPDLQAALTNLFEHN